MLEVREKKKERKERRDKKRENKREEKKKKDRLVGDKLGRQHTEKEINKSD